MIMFGALAENSAGARSGSPPTWHISHLPLLEDPPYRIVDVTKPDSPTVLDEKQLLTMLQGDIRKLRLEHKGESGYAGVNSTVERDSGTGHVLEIATNDQIHTLTGGNVKNEETSVLSFKSGGEDRARLTVKVRESVNRIDFETRLGTTLPEGQSLQLRVVAVGENSTRFKPSERNVEVDKIDPPNLVVVAPANDGFLITASNLSAVPAASPAPAATPGDPRKATIKFKTKAGKAGSEVTNNFVVIVTPNVGYITFEPPVREPLLPSGMISTKAIVHRRDNTTDADSKVEFRLENQADELWADVAQEGNKVQIHWREPAQEDIPVDSAGRKKRRPSQIRVTARAVVQGDQEVKSTLVVRMAEVAKFAPLRVKLNIMDELTATDLYGGPMAKEYYVLMVRLLNNMKDPDNGQYTGTSILAYSSSVEVAVGLEKRFNPDLKSGITVLSGDKARELDKQRSEQVLENLKAQVQADSSLSAGLRSRLTAAADRVKQTEKEALTAEREAESTEESARSDNRLAAELSRKRTTARRAREKADRALDELTKLQASLTKILVGARLPFPNAESLIPPRTAINDGRWYPASREDLIQVPGPFFNPNRFPLPKLEELPEHSYGEPPCINTITYRPFTFEMMVNTTDRREQRTFRAQFFRLLEGVGLATSFITAIAVPPSSSDLPLGLEKYSNLFLPGANKLYPDYKEQHRQNIVSQAMKPIEEIPFGSDISRVVFIPKKSIRGLISGHDARISQICPYFFRVEVAIIKKTGVSQSGTQQ